MKLLISRHMLEKIFKPDNVDIFNSLMSFRSHSSDVIVSGLKLNESLRAARPRKVTKAFVLCAARAGLDHSNYLLFYFGATLVVLLVLVVLTEDLYLVCLVF